MSHIAIILQETSMDIVKALTKFLSIYQNSKPNNLFTIASFQENQQPFTNYTLPLKPKIVDRYSIQMALSSTIQVISKSIFQSLQFLTVSPDTFQKQIFIFSSQPLNPTPLLTGCVFTASSLKIKVQIFSSKLNDSHQIARLCKGSFQVIQNDALELQIHDVFTGQARSNFDVSGQQFCCEKCQKKSVLGIFCSTCASQFCKVCGVVQCGKCGVVWE